MKVFWLILSLFCFGTLLFSGVYRCNDYYYGKDGVYTKPKEKCISERALEGCEQAGFDMEYQLRRCEIAFRYCAESNIELQEQIKGEK